LRHPKAVCAAKIGGEQLFEFGDPEVSKFSCGFPVVEFQQASQPLARLDFATRFTLKTAME
jgi:hypothetical protein